MSRTGLKTFAASDAFSAVGILNGIDIHGAGPGTASAGGAAFLIKLHPYQGDLLEQGIESSQRADVLAEGPVDDD